jgi:hypothetical protein
MVECRGGCIMNDKPIASYTVRDRYSNCMLGFTPLEHTVYPAGSNTVVSTDEEDEMSLHEQLVFIVGSGYFEA